MVPGARRARPSGLGGFALCVAGIAPACFGTPTEAQMRRASPLQPVSDVREGDLIVGIGLSHAWNSEHPLAAFGGDLWSLGEATIGYGLGDRALIVLDGTVRQRLAIDERGEPSVPLDSSTDDGTATDAGDFRVAVAFTPLGERLGLSYGAIVEVKLPNTTERAGIGPNTTDVTLGLLGSWGSRSVRATTMIGVAILEAPLENFEQNDLVAYAVDLSWRASRRFRLFGGTSGLGNTRRTVPLGTESRGVGYLGAEWAAGPWRFDVGIDRGHTGIAPDWRVGAGVSFVRSTGDRS